MPRGRRTRGEWGVGEEEEEEEEGGNFKLQVHIGGNMTNRKTVVMNVISVGKKWNTVCSLNVIGKKAVSCKYLIVLACIVQSDFNL